MWVGILFGAWAYKKGGWSHVIPASAVVAVASLLNVLFGYTDKIATSIIALFS